MWAQLARSFFKPDYFRAPNFDPYSDVLQGGTGLKPGTIRASTSTPPQRANDLASSEIALLEWLSKDDGQYGECCGGTLDGLIAKGFAKVHGQESGLDNGFIAKSRDLMYRAVSITDAGRAALLSQDHQP